MDEGDCFKNGTVYLLTEWFPKKMYGPGMEPVQTQYSISSVVLQCITEELLKKY